MTTALFTLRCVQLGLNIADLELLTIGEVSDLFLEDTRDSIEWQQEASQDDMKERATPSSRSPHLPQLSARRCWSSES